MVCWCAVVVGVVVVVAVVAAAVALWQEHGLHATPSTAKMCHSRLVCLPSLLSVVAAAAAVSDVTAR